MQNGKKLKLIERIIEKNELQNFSIDRHSFKNWIHQTIS